ncbi:hypothetical protein B0T10DRAFT_527853 [Thelonectria olida]|uniref:Uncharacterized protein n=1 Tax=Thelonectria olida TaxID=1576542 RepID=A0A9P9AV32_9HYPO|nr:hypothetical protein B0T10DRAFT_527853 [Thelonectria olida]
MRSQPRYGRVIVVGGVVLPWWDVGTIYAWGDGLSTPVTLPLIYSLDASLTSALEIINSRLMRALGMRWAAILWSRSWMEVNPRVPFSISGVLMGTGVRIPAACAIDERVPAHTLSFIEWRLFESFTFVLVLLASALGTFLLFVPPYFLGSSNTWFIALMLTAFSILAVWPFSTTLGPMIVFVVINGCSNEGTCGSARVAIAVSMILTGWAGGFYAGSLALAAADMVATERLRKNRSPWAKV